MDWKIGDRVYAAGAVEDLAADQVLVRFADRRATWARRDQVMQSAPTPRPDWEVLREHAKDARAGKHYGVEEWMLDLADRLEAAAAPKPMTLVEAVKSVTEWHPIAGTGALLELLPALREALAREEEKP